MLPPLQIFNAATSALFIVLGVLVARVRGGGAQNRAFAAHAIALGAAFFVMNVWTGGSVGVPQGALGRTLMLALVACFITSAAALVWLVAHLASPLGAGDRRDLALAAAIGLPFTVLQAAGVLDPVASIAIPPSERTVTIVILTGWGLGVGGFWMAIALGALRSARVRDPHAGALAQLSLVCLAAVLWPAYFSGVELIGSRGAALSGLYAVAHALTPMAVAALWLNAARVAPSRARSARAVAWATLASVLAGMTVFALTRGEDNAGFGIARLVSVAILAYAIVRHQLLGIDVKIRWGISKTTVAGVFIAVFFVASEAAQQFFGATLGGTYAGIAAAGALVFAIAPLQRAAERLAERAVPSAPPPAAPPRPEAPTSDRAEAYRRAVRVAMKDRRLSREEEDHLLDLAHHLGIPPSQASRIHGEIERETSEAA